MIKTNYLFLAGLLLFIFAGQSKAQSKSALEDQAYDYLNNNEFVKAYDAFDQLHARYPKELDYQFKLGIACLSYPEKKERAIEIFQDMVVRYKTREAEFYLGRAFHANYKFDQALNVLEPLVEALLPSKKKEDKTLVDNARQIINNCKNGKVLMQNKLNYHVKNIGGPINTKEIEGVPVITADESMMIFTYQGKKSVGGKVNASLQADPNGVYTSDIYMSTRATDSTWKTPEPIKALNTKGNDAAIAISPDGLTLFTFLSTNEIAGDIYVSKLNGTEFSKPEPLNSNINTPDYWEGSCSISADGKLLYFSSERPTGLGGRDIWVSELIDGDWAPAVNLGPKINTPYDDDAPFIHPDGVTMFFSSKGHTSIGGYDIMFSIKEGNEWSEPKSMGIPLNTVEDDSYYVINSKGDKGYFSSDRSTAAGSGGQDIYLVNPGILGEKPIVALYKGIINGDARPISARIDVAREGKDENLGPYYSNKSTGKYLLTLKPGYIYHIKINAEGYEPYEEDINLETLGSYSETKKDFNIYSKAYAASNPDKIKPGSVTEVIEAPISVAGTSTPTTTINETVTTGTTSVAVSDAEKQQAELKKQAEMLAKEEKGQLAVQKFVEDQKRIVQAREDEKKAREDAKLAKVEEKKAKEAEKVAKAEEKKAQAAAKAEEKQATMIAKAEEKKRRQEAKQHANDDNEVATVESTTPCDSKFPDLTSLKGKSLNDPENYRQLMSIAGNYCATNLVFKVQIGAYKNPSNFKYANLKGLGKVESTVGPDGITRFTQKQFSNLKDAEVHRQKSIARGQTDAWIVVFVGGQRYTLEDFIMADFLSKPVN